MSSIPSMPSSVANTYQTPDRYGLSQVIKSFEAVGSALQSGDLAGAKTALSAFQQKVSSNSSSATNQPFGGNTKANNDYQSLVNAVESGNLSDAQKAFGALQSDIKSSHKHHHENQAPPTITATNSPTTTNGSSGVNLNVMA